MTLNILFSKIFPQHPSGTMPPRRVVVWLVVFWIFWLFLFGMLATRPSPPPLEPKLMYSFISLLFIPLAIWAFMDLRALLNNCVSKLTLKKLMCTVALMYKFH